MTKRDFASHTLPAPIIKDAPSTVEDVAGSLNVAKTLLDSLVGDIEGMQELARRDSATVSPDAWKGRLESMWALAYSIGVFVSYDITLLEAVVDHHNNRQTL